MVAMSEGGELKPGFLVVHGNHPESLRELVLAWLARHPLAPLEDEWMLVQSNGVAQWLKLALAAPTSAGGMGIAAALRTELPSRFIWQAYRAVLGAASVPVASPLDKSLLVWRLVRLLPSLVQDEVYAPLARFLADDATGRKRHQLAQRLADLFDQYQVYRADWLQAWAAGDDRLQPSRGPAQPLPPQWRWQPCLWRALLSDVGAQGAQEGRAAVHQRFLNAVRQWQGPRPAGVPRRLTVFGVSSLPAQSLEVLAALAPWTQVLMCVHNPCRHDWSHVVADQDLLQAGRHRQRRRQGGEGEIAEESLHLHAQPLLAAWGKQGRDFIRLLDIHDEHEQYAGRFADIGQRIDCFDTGRTDTLLGQLQDDILDLRPLAETRQHWHGVDAVADRSIRFHVTHGPQREVEVLHDELLAALAADPTLQPRDVIVMVPDVATYAPHVQAVFGLHPRGDARHIPVHLADRGAVRQVPLLGALERLLALPSARLSVSDVLDWLEVPALRARFGLAESDLPLLHRWIGAANVRWGLHAEQRQHLDLPGANDANSWEFGLQRMLLGYAAGQEAVWAGIEPLDEVGGLEAQTLGPLVRLVRTLEHHWRVLGQSATPIQWGARLRQLLQDFFEPQDDADAALLMRLDSTLQEWLDACAQAALDEPLPLAVVATHWLAQMDTPSLQQPFFAGAVTVATLMPMRSIPFRFVALLGMNDGDYPRSREPLDFDLMAQDWRAGDRSRREDDRYLFLEALLAARERLHLSWVGRSIHDDSERAPSVLVAQLRDHLAAGWRLDGDAQRPAAEARHRLLQALTVEHRLQAFHPDYFRDGADPRLHSHAREWREGLRAATQPPPAMPPVELPERPLDGPLTLRRMTELLRSPARVFLAQRLGVHFDAQDPVADDQEPFALDALDNWSLQDELIQVQRQAVDEGRSRQDALDDHLQRLARRGDLPGGAFGVLLQEDLAEPMAPMFRHYERALADWPQPVPDESLDHLPDGCDEALRLLDTLGGLRRNGAGERCRLVLDSSSLVKGNAYQRDKLLGHWVAHVAAQLAGEPTRTFVISKAGHLSWPALPTQQAHALWLDLLHAWVANLRAPLPLAPKAGFEWLMRAGAGDDPGALAAAREAARAIYEDHDERHHRFAEVRDDRQQALARAFPDFDSLWTAGAFADWARRLYGPLHERVGKPTPEEGA